MPELLDEQAVRDRTGMKKNDYGMGTASILANGSMVKRLSERLRKELEVAGGGEGTRIQHIFIIDRRDFFAIPSRQTGQFIIIP